MKRTFSKLMLALVAGLALTSCAEIDVEGRGRGHVGLPPVIVPAPVVYEPGRDDEGYKKHKHKHKKDKDEGGDDDDDDDDHHHGKHKKD